MSIQRRELTPPKFEITLVSHEVNGETYTVNLRELHTKSKNGDEFAHWIKQRIEKYGFVENQDYIVFGNLPKNSQGGRPSKEYIGTLSMAKELAMVENNSIGKIARQYFIQCEKELLRQRHMPRGYPQMLEASRNGWKGVRNELIHLLRDMLRVHDRKRKSQITDQMYLPNYAFPVIHAPTQLAEAS